ncbi:unnamed protein product [Hyaloperonospora brassicae]|uniref:RxLR effector candidate protein n=1 Tax=Hyaloperonospora brassicae TaxID=162125 RepID=A0AAV0TF01_HYABA|nr:unnamed protein product [Hyaloperonospora brassicae]
MQFLTHVAFLVALLLVSLTVCEGTRAVSHSNDPTSRAAEDNDRRAAVGLNFRGLSTAPGAASSPEERRGGGAPVSATGGLHAVPHSHPIRVEKEMVENPKYVNNGLFQRIERWFGL